MPALALAGERKKGQQRRTGKIARPQEAARPQSEARWLGQAGFLKVGGKKLSTPLRDELIGGQLAAVGGRIGEPGSGRLAAVPGLGRSDRPPGPARKGLLEQGEVDQPFAGIVDDVKV